MQGHIRSILPQKGGIAPVDSNSVALFRYEEHAQDSIRGLRHIGEASALLTSATTNVLIENPPDISETNQVTVMSWFKRAGVAGSGYHILFVQDALEVEISIMESTGELRTGLFVNGARQVFNSGSPLTDGKWHHVAMTYDGSMIRSYADGKQVGTFATVGTLSKGTSWRIGKYNEYNANAYQADIQVYDVALSQQEINQAMSNVEIHTGLIGRWKLQDRDAIAYDSSGKGNDGIVSTPAYGEGRAVYSLKEGAVLIEEGTVNYVPPGERTCASSFQHQGGGTFTLEEGGQGRTDVNRISVVGSPGSDLYAYFGFYNAVTSVVGDIYTVSYEYKQIKGTGYPELQSIYANGYKLPDQSQAATLGPEEFIMLKDGWIRCSRKVTITVAGNTWFRWNMFSNEMDSEVLVDNFQIERKQYATSFIDGVRGAGNLQYQLPTISAPLTCSFWFKRTAGASTSQLVNLIDGTREWRLWLDWGSDMSFSLANLLSTGTVSYGRVDGGVVSSDWTFIAFVVSETELVLYQDGEVIGRSTHGVSVPNFELLTVGHHNEGAQPPINGMFDELRVDKIARTDQEIQAWYHHGRGMMG